MYMTNMNLSNEWGDRWRHDMGGEGAVCVKEEVIME